MEIRNYDDFIRALTAAGFSMGGGNDEGIYAVVPWNWNEEPAYDTSVRWHTGDAEHDPWEWRMRVLDERSDVAYGKLFFNKSGYILRDWYPCFLAVRRGGASFDDAYAAGRVSHVARRIYDVIAEHGTLPLHALKQLAGFDKASSGQFDRGLTELQKRMYLTICGRQQKLSAKGEEYGWNATVLCTTEAFFGAEVFAEAARLTSSEAYDKIRAQVLKLNPNAEEKKIKRFIEG